MRAVHVVAAAIIDAHDRVLIAQRLTGKHMAGGWEFPGGKLEAGEERRAGLARELREELGIEVQAADLRPLMRVTHPYPTRTILLDTWVIRRWGGEPRGLEGQPLRWCPLRELGGAGLLPADAPIVAALNLPERLHAAETAVYALRSPDELPLARAPGTRLLGALCEGREDALEARRRGAELIAISRRLDEAGLRGLCDALDVPVYARDLTLEAAWRVGATGVNEVI